MKTNKTRREFLKNSAATGIAAPAILRSTARANQAHLPLVVSSSNVSRSPDGQAFQGGIACVTRAMEMIKNGRDTLEAVVAGVNIVENDPRDNSVGYGGLPNEEGEVELELDDGAKRTVRQGGIVVQRGTNHLWRNTTDKPCRIAFVLIDAPAYMHNGRPLPEDKPDLK